jgi:hypothetical protein
LTLKISTIPYQFLNLSNGEFSNLSLWFRHGKIDGQLKNQAKLLRFAGCMYLLSTGLFTAKVFSDAIIAVQVSDAFIGHIGGDDFVLVVPTHQAQATADEIARRFDEGIIKFYSPEDAAAKCIQSVNRQGENTV